MSVIYSYFGKILECPVFVQYSCASARQIQWFGGIATKKSCPVAMQAVGKLATM